MSQAIKHDKGTKQMSDILENGEVEEWRGIDGLENHEISSFGRVKRNGKISDAKKYIILTNKGKRLSFTTSRLVALTFLKDTYQNGKVVAHKDGDSYNSKASNLEWVDRCAFIRKANPDTKIKVINIRKDILSGLSYADIAKKYDVCPKYVSDLAYGCHGKTVTEYKQEVADFVNARKEEKKRGQLRDKLIREKNLQFNPDKEKIAERLLDIEQGKAQPTQSMFDGKPIEVTQYKTLSGELVSLPRVKFLENRI